jgi:hypothetical protein
VVVKLGRGIVVGEGEMLKFVPLRKVQPSAS